MSTTRTAVIAQKGSLHNVPSWPMLGIACSSSSCEALLGLAGRELVPASLLGHTSQPQRRHMTKPK